MKKRIFSAAAVRRLVYVLLTVLFYIIQCVWLPGTALPFPVFLLIPLSVGISMFEREFSGMFFGLITGALWDIASPVTDGFMALLLTAAGCLTGLLSHYMLRNTILTSVILTSVMSAAVSLLNILYYGISYGFDGMGVIFMKLYLPAIIISSLLTLPVYTLVKKTAMRFSDNKI